MFGERRNKWIEMLNFLCRELIIHEILDRAFTYFEIYQSFPITFKRIDIIDLEKDKDSVGEIGAST